MNDQNTPDAPTPRPRGQPSPAPPGQSARSRAGDPGREEEETYLWERKGRPDPLVQRLERMLEPLRYRGELPDPPAAARLRRHPPRLAGAALAATVLLAAGLAWLALRGRDTARPTWALTAGTGPFTIDSDPAATTGRLAPGQWLETSEGATVRLSVGEIGTVNVGPATRLSLVAAGPDEHRLRLQRGRIEALILAPPRLFFVDTPSALAVDYGCSYVLTVDAAGDGELSVTAGFVSLEHGGRRAIVPRGFVCLARAGRGPGTPFAADAPQALRRALLDLDFGPGAQEALRAALRDARSDDAITLWHLLGRTEPGTATAVLDRLSALSAPPSGVTREGVLAHDQAMLDAWGADLGLPTWR
jgi:ferric-dicitrate binding protein FerR (iron transport regulator)